MRREGLERPSLTRRVGGLQPPCFSQFAYLRIDTSPQRCWLGYQDSNLDGQNQNLLGYRLPNTPQAHQAGACPVGVRLAAHRVFRVPTGGPRSPTGNP